MKKIVASEVANLIQHQQARASRLGAQGPQNYSQFGKVLVTNSGPVSESIVTVTFAHAYTEEPHFTFGGVMDVRQQIVNGSFPTVSAVVQGWASGRESGSFFYKGATLAIVTTGVDAQRMWVNYRFEGYALSFNLPS